MPSNPHLPALQDDGGSGRPRISRKVSAAIDALLNGEAKTIKEAAESAGMARETLSRALGKPHVQAEMQARVDKLLKGASVVRAAAVLGHLLDAGSEHVRLKAAELVLAINGHRPPPAGVNLQINNNFTPGWIVDLTEPAGLHSPDPGGPIIDTTATTIEEDPL